jgi:hypothetical protein
MADMYWCEVSDIQCYDRQIFTGLEGWPVLSQEAAPNFAALLLPQYQKTW